jgi:tetratricopeptide (TPR) repeat protein
MDPRHRVAAVLEFRLSGDRLVRGTSARVLTAADHADFARWGEGYHAIARRGDNKAGLLRLGQDIKDWLDGPERWLSGLPKPAIACFAVDERPDEAARRFLDVPWELAADKTGFLAAAAGTMWTPLRRIGPTREPPKPDGEFRLSALFMAAAPRGPDELDFDAEESAILKATAKAGLDLHVEDSGTLAELVPHWARLSPEVLHVSCHGTAEPEPALALEDPTGGLALATLPDLAGEFVDRGPRLLFLSACHTGDGAADTALAGQLVETGFPAVLSWADSVYDTDASDFAATFYAALALPRTRLEAAYAQARFKLLQPKPDARVPAHWHQARLFLGPTGGGVLTGGTKARLAAGADAGRKQILAARGGSIEVASRTDFVGRRRPIQAIRRAFAPGSGAVGALIHGLGRQGKSSLAARIIDRYPDLTPIILYQRCDGPSLLDEIRRRRSEDAVAEICGRYRNAVDANHADYDPTALGRAFRQLLEDPYRDRGLLIVLDDFEQCLDEPVASGEHRLKPIAAQTLSALIEALDGVNSASRLIITSRYTFACRGETGRDLLPLLLDVSLAALSRAEAVRQARQKLLGGRPPPPGFDALAGRAIAAARGNAGLQDLLFRLALADSGKGGEAIAGLEAFLADGTAPDQEELRRTLEGLLIDRLLGFLTEAERLLLGASTLFRLPTPLALWQGWGEAASLGRPDRLLAFGLWEIAADLVDPERLAITPNVIATARLAPPKHADQILAALIQPLFAAWGGADRSRTPYATDIELCRLALDGGALDVLVATAEYAIRGLEREFNYRAAAELSTRVLDRLSQAGRSPDPGLLRAAAEIYDHTGDAARLQALYETAGSIIAADDPTLPKDERTARAGLRLRYGAWLARRGEPDRALAELEATCTIFEALGDRRSRAVTLGDIARIRGAKGEVDAALALHQEQIAIFEALGDRRSRAVTLGDIARIRGAKGEVDAALALHQEQIAIFEALGDRRERAVTLGDIARIRGAKGEVDAALALHQERLATYEALGDRPEIAHASFEIGSIQLNQALAGQDGELFAQALGALGTSYQILCETGRLDGICVVGMTFGQALAMAGASEEARPILARSVEGFRRLGWQGRAEQAESVLTSLG